MSGLRYRPPAYNMGVQRTPRDRSVIELEPRSRRLSTPPSVVWRSNGGRHSPLVDQVSPDGLRFSVPAIPDK